MTRNTDRIDALRCPATGKPLTRQGEALLSPAGHRFPIIDGVPHLVWPVTLTEGEARTQAAYDHMAAQIYDAALEWQFAAIYEDEDRVREGMVDQLDLAPTHRVLEVGCGNGRDSFRIARRLGAEGSLSMQDLSGGMVHECIRNMEEYTRRMGLRCTLDYTVSNATYLPYPDDYFDRVFHFGGFNEFSDHRRAAAELARVVKPGGKVLFGDEAVGPWLRDTEFGRIVTVNNPLFAHRVPLEVLPEGAREVSVRWIMANCFYVISFVKGDGPPPLDLDRPHKGWRGGTLRSRYYGVLEGVRPETKEMIRQAAAHKGQSIYEWLDGHTRRCAEADLAEPGNGED